jgi:hypothetical protein
VRNVHVVGSVPLSNAAEVFTITGETLGDRLKRYPDGETGPRTEWVQWQIRSVIDHPQFEKTVDKPVVFGHAPATRSERVYYKLKDGVAPSDVRFEPLGYAEHAAASYVEFKGLRERGIIPKTTRFMVAIPSPLAFQFALINGPDRAKVEPAYMERLLQEICDIASVVPPRDLAIQFDCVFEMLILEGARSSQIDDSRESLIARLARIGDRVPAEAELGYHFCYGDMEHRHSVEPPNLSVMVDMANRLSVALHRRLDYLHFPVPRDRQDDAYFEPASKLRLSPETELYLGLIHYTDGVAGTRRRMATADRHLSRYGLATECGFGRRPPETIRELLKLHISCAAF